LTADIPLIEEWALKLRPAIVHLGAAPELLGPGDTASLKRKLTGIRLMRSIPVVGKASIETARNYDGIADCLLLDSHRESDRQIGALGITHDWSISRRIVECVNTPVILAGGLGPDNVADAIRSVRPAGVDSKTKTDRNGSHQKDLGWPKRSRRNTETAAIILTSRSILVVQRTRPVESLSRKVQEAAQLGGICLLRWFRCSLPPL
jgi:phosphoribosylanthranilate isomerase